MKNINTVILRDIDFLIKKSKRKNKKGVIVEYTSYYITVPPNYFKNGPLNKKGKINVEIHQINEVKENANAR